MTRLEKAEENAKKALAKVKAEKEKIKEKERMKAAAERRYKRIGKIVETVAAVEIVDFDAFSAYIKQYSYAIKNTQINARKETTATEEEI